MRKKVLSVSSIHLCGSQSLFLNRKKNNKLSVSTQFDKTGKSLNKKIWNIKNLRFALGVLHSTKVCILQTL